MTSYIQIGTAAAAFMAIRVLLDHGVNEDHIIFVTFLVARAGGVSILRKAFPNVKIVCSGVDEEMQEGWLEGYRGEGNPEGLGRKVWIMKPGMGQIGSLMSSLCCRVLICFAQGDRYYI
jgi:uridine kinase